MLDFRERTRQYSRVFIVFFVAVQSLLSFESIYDAVGAFKTFAPVVAVPYTLLNSLRGITWTHVDRIVFEIGIELSIVGKSVIRTAIDRGQTDIGRKRFVKVLRVQEKPG